MRWHKATWILYWSLMLAIGLQVAKLYLTVESLEHQLHAIRQQLYDDDETPDPDIAPPHLTPYSDYNEWVPLPPHKCTYGRRLP